MKKVLILVVSSQKPPYDVMMQTALDTWDSFEVEGTETIYYCGSPRKDNTHKVIYFDIREGYDTMGYKMLEAFDWALKNKEFDYIARVNSSCYVDKNELIKYVQTLESDKVFAGVEIKDKVNWCWGGLQFIISKDVIQSVVDNKDKYNHSLMEDMAISHLVKDIGFEFTAGRGCSIDKMDKCWRLMPYGTCDAFEFTNFEDVKKANQFFYRVKMDGQRYIDKYLMQELFKVLA